MLEATRLDFERAAREFACWQSVPKKERSPAPGWWWGTAIAIMEEQEAMPPSWCDYMELPSSSSYAQAAAVLMNSISDQTSLPWPGEFPRKVAPSEPEEL